jgi:pantoate--beta-alanine ligase
MDPMTPSLTMSDTPHAPGGATVVRSKDELRAALAPRRGEATTIGLVPTMGYLHDGHVSLLRTAREQCDVVVMSLFVNPTQFGPGEDLDRYPRDEERDLGIAAATGVDFVYAPAVEEVYPGAFSTSVAVSGLTEVLDGDRSRRGPGHFLGVTTVVAKLFNTVQPDVAFFGQKDAQQLAVIRRMVRDLDFPVRVEGLPTVREEDGLAMSSRNAYLGDADRGRATALSRALRIAEIRARETSLAEGIAAARSELAEAGIEPEYLEARDPEDLSPVERLDQRPVLLAVAAQVGAARLIDNVLITPADQT